MRPNRRRARCRVALATLGLWVGHAVEPALPAAVGSGVGRLIPCDRPTVMIVVGAPGEEPFGRSFEQWAERWQQIARGAGAACVTLGLPSSASPVVRLELEAALEAEPKVGTGGLWLVLLGHGTDDGKEAKFNLRGPDLTPMDLVAWLRPFQRPLALINTASSSAPFLPALSASGRVILTATRSGSEHNFTRFGEYLVAAMADGGSDLDRDGQTSLLEGFLRAAFETLEFYRREGRLATEHPLIDDNGDGLGTPPDWFRGVRAVRRAKDGASPDGGRAHQLHLLQSDRERLLPAEVRVRRDALERDLSEWREGKASMPEKDYFERLERLLVELARLYETSGRTGDPGP